MYRVVGVLLTILLWMGVMTPVHADEFQQLIRDLRSSDEGTRVRAVTTLGDSGDMRALQPLLEALRDESALVRKHAVEALRHFVNVMSGVSQIMQWWLRDLLNRLGIGPQEPVIPVEHPIRT